MNIVLVGNVSIPAVKYGAIERIMWWLGKELHRLGHQVSYLVNAPSSCPFAKVITRNTQLAIEQQIPTNADIVHFHYPIGSYEDKPHVVTIHGNSPMGTPFSINSIFVSKDHATRYGAETFVYNGIDPEEYDKPNLQTDGSYFHFLGKAAWRVKNVKGAIAVASRAKTKLLVLGGTRLNFKMGFRFTASRNISFKGMVDGDYKNELIRQSRGMIFPVRWHEPFGIAMTESLYLGCPVFATPYGAIPELIIPEVGVLSNNAKALAEAVSAADTFDRKICHEYVCDQFLARQMAKDYLVKYETVMNGKTLNKSVPALVDQGQPRFLPWNNE